MNIRPDILERIRREAPCFCHVHQPEGRYVNDHCFIMKDGLVHLFHIEGQVGKTCMDEGNEITIGHAVSRDLLHWEACAPALVRDTGMAHEERGVFAPFVMEKDGVFYMFYSSHNRHFAQYMCLALSRDLFHWTRHPGNPLFHPRGSKLFWDAGLPCSCRDPHIHHDAGNHRYIMFWVGDMAADRELSCIHASVSPDLIRWEEANPVLVRRHSVHECLVMKTESPCLVWNHGLYYLFFRHGNGTKYCISRDPLDFNHCDAHYLSSAHAAEIFRHEGHWIISSCSRSPLDIIHREDRTKGLYVAGLSWEDMHPEVVDIFHTR
ncbi:MAG: family 43 glycosylhydrolase [Clostridia bacterium]